MHRIRKIWRVYRKVHYIQRLDWTHARPYFVRQRHASRRYERSQRRALTQTWSRLMSAEVRCCALCVIIAAAESFLCTVWLDCELGLWFPGARWSEELAWCFLGSKAMSLRSFTPIKHRLTRKGCTGVISPFPLLSFCSARFMWSLTCHYASASTFRLIMQAKYDHFRQKATEQTPMRKDGCTISGKWGGTIFIY